MKNIKITSLLTSLCLTLSACGGGGGDGDDSTNVSGTWRGALTQISNTCNTSAPSTINIAHTVLQNEDAITLTAESGVLFIGNTVGDNGFSVDGNHSTIGSPQCNDQTRIEYDSINDDSDSTADIAITINRTCGASNTCRLDYAGAVSRTSSGPNPDPTPVVETTPIAGGCLAVNPNPAADLYEGDGGCGISNAGFSVSGNAVVLEPFGANGLTTFNVDAANNAVATSARTDLTILGDAGYNCSMTCSPPSTFSVRCLKEGATSCVEKF